MVSCRSILVLLGGFLLHLTLGTGYTFGNMAPYIISYIRVFGNNLNVTTNDAIWVQAMIAVGQGLFMSIGGLIDNRLGPRMTTYIGSMFATTSVAVSYFSIKCSLMVFALTYGFTYGIGIGIAYASPLGAGMKWFPNNKGLVNGIVVAGFGLGAFVFTQVQTGYLNPHNSASNKDGYFTDPYVLNRVPNVFLLLGAIYGLLQLIGCSMLTLPKQVSKKRPDEIIDGKIETISDYYYGSVEKIIKTTSDLELTKLPCNDTSIDEIILYESFTPKQIFRYRQFYILWFTFFFNSQIVNYISSMYKIYGQTFIKDDQFLATVGAVAAVFNAGGRILWGLLIDKFNYKVCMLVLTAGLSILMATLNFTETGGKIMFAVWIWAIFFFFSGNFCLLPTCTTQTFGIGHAVINYGLIFSTTIISSPLSAIITQNFNSQIGWNAMFGLLAGFSAISFILTLFFRNLQCV